MSSIKNYNEFKLLAFRPLEGMAPDLLKSLQKNCIYSIYNEYQYTLKDGTNEIESIKYIPSVPVNLYGNNITVSAIVGQNGSGKSSLLELFYYAILLANKEHLDNDTELEIKFNAELIILYGKCIKVLRINNESTKAIVFKRGDENEFVKDKLTSDKVDLDFYTNVLNYSIYGLNSNLIPWIDSVFYKNDAYQLPIVINPFKEYGNYDINREYMLMQSRAVFYTYVLGFKEIIEDIFIHNIHFEISINKILKIDNSRSTFTMLQQFLELNVSKTVYDNLLFKNINRDNLLTLESISNLLGDKPKEKKIEYCIVFYNRDLVDINLYKTFSYLYIFKKLYKISKTYNKYKKYHFLFSDKLPFDFHFYNTNQNLEILINPKLTDKINTEIIYEQIMISLDLTGGESAGLKEDDLFYIKESFMSFYRVIHSGPNNIDRHLQKLKYNRDNILNNVVPTKELIQELFNGQEFRQYLFGDYISELNKDTSHITFKLKQAIQYFNLDIFSSIETDKCSIISNENNFQIKLSIDKEYFKDRNKIEDIPLAIFNHVIMVVKSKEKDETKRNKLINNNKIKPYPYTSLSSGEQHLINSILTIAYHNYNLLSVRTDSGLKKYKNINLVFDELELYLHPEYQRVYINNLITVLNKIQEITNQNDIYYNILMVTHSPFILSDIPSQNILKLENGEPKPNDNVNSFAANIYDLLKDEFFLKDGAIGAYVSDKIKSILKKDIIEKDDIEVINLIGDPFLKGVINKQIENKVSTEILNKEIMRLQEILTNRS
jgi:predicted ATPase